MTAAPPPPAHARVWTAPACVGAVTAAGLAGALLTDGPLAQAAGCVAVAAPLLTLAALGVARLSRRRGGAKRG